MQNTFHYSYYYYHYHDYHEQKVQGCESSGNMHPHIRPSYGHGK